MTHRWVLVGVALWTAYPQPDEARGPDASTVPGLDCEAPDSGALVLDSVEGEPGYDAALAAVDLDALPALVSVAEAPPFERELVAWMLEQDTVDQIDRDAARATPLGRAVLASVASAPAGQVDLPMLRRGLHRFYACARGLPPTLEAFRRDVHDFTADAVAETVESRVKGLPRRIRRSVVHEVFVAETLRLDGSVRETEILLTGRRADSDLEFLEYDEEGLLRGASTFASSSGEASVGAVPFSCITCHGTRDVVPPQSSP